MNWYLYLYYTSSGTNWNGLVVPAGNYFFGLHGAPQYGYTYYWWGKVLGTTAPDCCTFSPVTGWTYLTKIGDQCNLQNASFSLAPGSS